MCQSPFFNIVAGLGPATLLKKRLWHRCSSVNFAKFLRTTFLQNTYGRLLLNPFTSICSVSVLYSYQFFVSCKNLFKGGFANQPSKSLKIFLAKFGIWDWLPFVMLRKINKNKNKNEKETKLSCITTTDIAQRSLHKISRRNTT